MSNFVHLHAHTSIGSMQDAMTNVYDMFKKAAELGQTSLAITDHGTIAAAFDARRASLKHGVKYIPGCEAYFVDDVSVKKKQRRHIVLLAKNEQGYRNLLSLNYEGYTHNEYIPILGRVFPRVDWEILEKYSEGIICMTACGSGILSTQMFNHDESGEWNESACDIDVADIVIKLKKIFGEDLYLELQPHELKVFHRNRKTGDVIKTPLQVEKVKVDQVHINRKLVRLATEHDIKMVATADIHYLTRGDAKIHDMLMAINSKRPLNDPLRHRYDVEEFYMKSYDDIMEYFTDHFDEDLAQELCDNTMEIAGKCEDSKYLDVTEARFPQFDCSSETDYQDFIEWGAVQKYNGIPEDCAFMRYRCVKGFKKKYGHLKGDERKLYIKRMQDEVKVLEERNFSSYMLIVSDFIIKAKNRGIPVGPGRGSVGGSLVANLLDIHAVDPIQYGLLFERFHNIEKTSFPDIDTDFSPDGRDWVKEYIVKKYGKKNTAHVSNLSRMTPKVVIKDIARSLEIGGSKSEAFKIANKITDSIPSTAGTFDEALAQSPEFRKFINKYPDIERYGRKLVGLEKAYATHAAGVVISDIDLTTYVPLRVDKNGDTSVQYDKNRCEAEGLIKMDLLGLEHLRIIDNTIKNARALGLECLDSEVVPFDDKSVWENISMGKTMCVFQMESAHMKTLCKQIKPKSIEDLSLVNALGRPSAGKSRAAYIARRDGKEKVTFKYECLRPALEETLGICVYEEQLAKLANCVAGWDLNKADGLRKLTKMKEKGKELALGLKGDFIKDAISHSNLSHEGAIDIWQNIIEPFAGYGFNKAHGILYSINGYHSAYYKHYFPSSFMAAVLKSEVEKASSATRDSNIRLYKREAKRMGLKINAPDINKSGKSFTVLNMDTIVTGLEAVKGVGAKAVSNILETRDEHEFKSFSDFLYRTRSAVIKKDVIQSLAKAGCFDGQGITRKSAFTYYADLRKLGLKHAKKIAAEGRDAWNVMDDLVDEKTVGNGDWNKEWGIKEKLTGEGETLGEYISGSINDLYDGFFTGNGVTPLSRLSRVASGTLIRTESVVSNVVKKKLTKGRNSGKVYAKCTVTDAHNTSTQIVVWPERWAKYKESLEIGLPVRAICKVKSYNDNNTLELERIENVIR